jgi:hypothetical protein
VVAKLAAQGKHQGGLSATNWATKPNGEHALFVIAMFWLFRDSIPLRKVPRMVKVLVGVSMVVMVRIVAMIVSLRS